VRKRPDRQGRLQLVSELRLCLGDKVVALPNINLARQIAALLEDRHAISWRLLYGRMRMFWTPIVEWNQRRKLRGMLQDPRSTRGFRSTGQLEKGIGADRRTTERLLLAIGARKSDVAEEWTLNPL